MTEKTIFDRFPWAASWGREIDVYKEIPILGSLCVTCWWCRCATKVHNLKEGDACPGCGSTKPGDRGDNERMIRDKVKDARDAAKKIVNLMRDLSGHVHSGAWPCTYSIEEAADKIHHDLKEMLEHHILKKRDG